MKVSKAIIAPLLVMSLIGLPGCSDDDDDDDSIGGESNVTSASLQESTLRRGESTVLEIEFSFDSSRVFDDGENVAVVVRLPQGVGFQDGSAELDTNIGDDENIGAQVTNCGSGETYVVLDMDGDDLDQADNPGGDADAKVTMTVNAIAPADGEIAVRADATPIFTCGGVFPPEEIARVNVL